MAQAISDDLVDQLGNITDEQWLDMLLRSLEDPVVDGIALPAFPDGELQKITNNQSGRTTMANAFTFYKFARQLAKRHGEWVRRDSRVLDYGCGWGRIYRCFLREVPMSGMFGVDVQSNLIDACQDSFPPAQFKLIKPDCKLPFADETFDLVFANSVFSHLTEDLHRRTIRELSRVTKHNGLIICTVISDTALAKLAKRDDSAENWFAGILGDLAMAVAKVREDGFLWGSSGRRGTLSEYGLTIITDRWIQENWPAELRVREILHTESYSQSFAVARKQ